MVSRSPETTYKEEWSQKPDAWATGADNSAAIDVSEFRQISVHTRVGTLGSSSTIDTKVQDSLDGSTGWTDIAGAAITQITAADTSGRIRVKAEQLRDGAKFIRIVQEVLVATSDVTTVVILSMPVVSAAVAQTWNLATE